VSDNWINLVPIDRDFIPEVEKQSLAKQHFASIAPEADEIEITVLDYAKLFDCGGNLKTVTCPTCQGSIDPFDWEDWADECDSEDAGFKFIKFKMPCCGASHSLDELQYDWPQAFGRFAIEALNPDIGQLTPEQIQQFEQILGCKLHVIYQHI